MPRGKCCQETTVGSKTCIFRGDPATVPQTSEVIPKTHQMQDSILRGTRFNDHRARGTPAHFVVMMSSVQPRDLCKNFKQKRNCRTRVFSQVSKGCDTIHNTGRKNELNTLLLHIVVSLSSSFRPRLSNSLRKGELV
jgi:hypothetical protein